MSWEYWQLKRELAIKHTRLLGLFEEYCDKGQTMLSRMEWSCKLSRNSLLVDRFVHVSRARPEGRLLAALQHLLDRLQFTPRALGIEPRSWNSLLENVAERLFVAYSGPGMVNNADAVVKVYLALPSPSDIAYNSVVRPFLPELQAKPPGSPGILLGVSLSSQGHAAPRVYVFYDRAEYDDGETRAYLTALLGGKAFQLLRRFARSALSFKCDSTVWYYFAVTQEDKDILALIASRAHACPALLRRLDRLTWVGVSATDRLEAPDNEWNTYVRLLSQL